MSIGLDAITRTSESSRDDYPHPQPRTMRICYLLCRCGPLMRALQVLAGIIFGVGLLWLAVTQYLGRPVYASLPPLLEELPWSDNPAEPARVATALLLKPCKTLQTNTDLQVCLRTHGLKTGVTGGEFWAKFEAGNGFAPDVHQLTWSSSNNELPMQMDAVKG